MAHKLDHCEATPLPDVLASEDQVATSRAAVTPRRVLVVSADMGGGHNATAAALEEAVQRLWPGSEVRRVDALDLMGPGVGWGFRWIYVANVETTPWLYELFYSALWRHDWFARASKRFTGSWCGRRLAPQIDRFDPDFIVSTYPLGSAGLAWLRRHRGLQLPTAAWVSDFAPHPFWVYRDIDFNFVMHEAALPLVGVAEPGAAVAVSAPPVVSAFQPGERAGARERLGLRQDAFVVLVSCGAYAFGDVEATVTALLEADRQVQVIAACGRNQVTFQRLKHLGHGHDRLVPMGWTDDMATLVQAADVVFTNAGGATALEALACGRPVLMARPIAAHGAANAALMVVAGLAEVCATEDRLREHVRATLLDRTLLAELEQRAQQHVSSHDLDDGLERLASTRPLPSPRRRAWPARPSDVFFAHVESADLPQELGVVLELDSLPDGQPVSLAAVRHNMATRAPGLAPMRRRLVDGPSPGWLFHDVVPVENHVDEHELPSDAEPSQMWDVVSRFWSERMPPGQPSWQMLLVRRGSRGQTLLAIKLHHTQGDGISALGLLDRLLDSEPSDPLIERKPSEAADRTGGRQTGGSQGPTDGADGRAHASRSPRTAAARVAGSTGLAVARGLWHLATRGPVPKHPLNRPVASRSRVVVPVSLEWERMRSVARAYGARPHEFVIALVADALTRLLQPAGLIDSAKPLRVMVPVAVRPPRLDRIFGNWAGSVALDLPLGPMSMADRVEAVCSELRRRVQRGEPQAAAAVMQVVGQLPAGLHARFARLVYTKRFFNSIVSYMPGARGPRKCAGAPVTAMIPVLPLAEGVPLMVGVIIAHRTAGFGILLDPQLGLAATAIRNAFDAAFAAAEVGVALNSDDEALLADETGSRQREVG